MLKVIVVDDEALVRSGVAMILGAPGTSRSWAGVTARMPWRCSCAIALMSFCSTSGCRMSTV